MKCIGAVHNKDMCSMLYSIHTNSSLLQEAEERQNKMLDCNYLKAVVDAVVSSLDINNDNR